MARCFLGRCFFSLSATFSLPVAELSSLPFSSFAAGFSASKKVSSLPGDLISVVSSFSLDSVEPSLASPAPDLSAGSEAAVLDSGSSLSFASPPPDFSVCFGAGLFDSAFSVPPREMVF